MRSIFILVYLSFITNSLFSQEVLNDLFINPELAKTQPPKSSLKNSKAILSLPFFDDFSNKADYPSSDLWEDFNVYVNTNYGILPPSIGVATFDAVDARGFVYESLSENPSAADTLTSHKIDLSGADRNTTYLSFYYQPQGNGNAPEFNDSLVLNILVNDTVYRIWYANGTEYKSFKNDTLHIPDNRPDTLEFKLVHFKLDNPDFFTNNLQLQFINYVSIPNIIVNPSGRTNADHWNIDYILLDDNRSEADTIFKDMAMVQPSTLFMKDYSSVPWNHFQSAINKQLSDIVFSIRNNDSKKRSMNQLILNIKNLETGTIKDFYIGQKDIERFENKPNISWGFTSLPIEWYAADSVSYEISGEIKTDEGDPVSNNFTSRIVKYKDYYSYDDGSAEKTYGVDNNRAKVAYKYDIYKGDSLRAIQIYFVRNKEEFNKVQSFTFCIWDDYNNTPGDIILKETGKRPVYSDNLNEFVTINLDSVIYLEGKFYIGWEQNSALLMNVGFDVNTNRANRLFYNVNSEWYASDYNGSLMMRPVFGKSKNGTAIHSTKEFARLKIAPNPSNGFITLQNRDINSKGFVQVFDYLGKLVFYKNIYSNEKLDVNHLCNGLYIITYVSESGLSESARLVISK